MPFPLCKIRLPSQLTNRWATATKGHDCNNREMLPIAIFILLDIYYLLKKGLFKRNVDRIISTAMPNMPIL